MAVRVNPLRPLLRRLPAPLRNRYRLVLLIFVVWVAFFDKHDLYTQWKLQQTVSKLNADRDYFARQIEAIQQDRKDIEANKEKFAREHFYMRKNGEDVFIFVDK